MLSDILKKRIIIKLINGEGIIKGKGRGPKVVVEISKDQYTSGPENSSNNNGSLGG